MRIWMTYGGHSNHQKFSITGVFVLKVKIPNNLRPGNGWKVDKNILVGMKTEHCNQETFLMIDDDF